MARRPRAVPRVDRRAGRLRVTGGRLAGRRLAVPPGEIRPLMDRMRESLFAVLEPLLPGADARVLDLFAGSGVAGIEAVSRGAVWVDSVEQDRGKIAVLRHNLSVLDGVGAVWRVHATTAESFVAGVPGLSSTGPPAGRRWDLIIVDPPFRFPGRLELLDAIGRVPLAATGGLLVLHLPATESLPRAPRGLIQVDERRYGGSVALLFRPAPAGANDPAGPPASTH